MTEPYLGEIQILGFTYPPYQWAFCAGQTMAIQQNAALYALIGTTYGGNGTTNFQLPNLASRMPCNAGPGPGLTQRTLGETFGEFGVTLTTQEMPSHNHAMNIYSSAATRTDAPTAQSTIGTLDTNAIYAAPGAAALMSPMAVMPTGNGEPHSNIQPTLALNFSIALSGVFPAFS